MIKKIINKPKVIEISKRMWKIPQLGHIVTLQIKKGRRIWTCNCQNHARFCVENSWCYDKELVNEYIVKKPIFEHLDKLIKDYEGFLHIKGKLEPYAFVNDLKNLRRSL